MAEEGGQQALNQGAEALHQEAEEGGQLPPHLGDQVPSLVAALEFLFSLWKWAPELGLSF